jgi:hypothetical protein
MAKIDMFCPFSHKLCDECPLYRGRHYYLCFYPRYRGYIENAKGNAKPGTDQHPVDFSAVWKRLHPWADNLRPEAKPEIKLKVIDMEKGETRIYELDEAKTWDWGNQEIWKVVDGFQVTSWDKLVELALSKAKKGYREVEVCEVPRFLIA